MPLPLYATIFKSFAKEFLHQKHGLLLASVFLLLTASLFGLALTPAIPPMHLSSILPILLVVLSLLTILLGTDTLFAPLVRQQFLSLFLLYPRSFPALVMLRIITHWFFHTLPIAILIPLVIQPLLLASPFVHPILLVSLPLGSLSLSLLNALIAALSLGLPSGTFLRTLLFIPLALPLLLLTLITATRPLAATETLSALLFLLLSLPILAIVNLIFTPPLLKQTFS